MAMLGNNLRKLNKKGSLIDIIFIGLVLTVFSIVVLVGLKIAGDFETQIDSNPIFADGIAREQVELTRVKYTNTIDNTFLILTILLAMAVIAMAALVRIHPMFIPFYFIGWVIVIFVSGIFSNIYQAMAADANLVDTAAELTFINNIMVAIPILVGIIGIVLMIVMYKLYSNAQQ